MTLSFSLDLGHLAHFQLRVFTLAVLSLPTSSVSPLLEDMPLMLQAFTLPCFTLRLPWLERQQHLLPSSTP